MSISSIGSVLQQLFGHHVTPPRTHVVQAGEQAPQIAQRYGVDEAALRLANPQVADWNALPSLVELVLPEPTDAAPDALLQDAPPGTPGAAATPEARRTDAALQARQRAQAHVDNNDRLVAQGSKAAAADRPALRQQLAAADRELAAAIAAEARAGFEAGPMASHPTGAVYDAAAIGEQGRAIAARHADDPAARSLVEGNVAQLQAAYERDALIPNMLAAGDDPKAALDGLEHDLSRLDPAQQAQVLADPRVQGLVNRAVAWAGEPLAGREGESLQYALGLGNTSARRLADLAEGLPPELAQRLAQAALPLLDRIAQATKTRPSDDPGSNPSGDPRYTTSDRMTSLSRLVDALGDPTSPQARPLIERIAGGYLGIGDSNGAGRIAQNAVAQGNSPTLVLELARQVDASGNTRGASELVVGATDGVSAQHQKATDALAAYSEHVRELAFLLENSAGLPPDQLKAAIDRYIASKGPAWQRRADELKGNLEAASRDASVSMAQLHALPPELRTGYTDRFLQRVGDDPNTAKFIDYATASDPSLLRGEPGNQLFKFVVDGVKIGKEQAEMGRRIASRYVAQQGLDAIADVKPGDTASIDRAIARMTALGDSRLCAMLGVSPTDYRRAVLSLEKTLEYPVDMQASFDVRVRGIENHFRDPANAPVFAEGTLAGSLFRTLNFGAATVLLGSAGMEFAKDPSVAKGLAALSDAAGFGKDGYEAMASIAKSPANGVAIKGLGILSAAGDLYNAFTHATGLGATQDPAKAALFGLGAAGTLTMTLTTGPYGAMIGAVMVLASVFGMSELEGDRAAHQFETPASAAYLEALGFDREAADVLKMQSEEGHGALPLLVQYAQHKGYDLSKPEDWQAFVAWVNDCPPDKLGSLRGLLGASMDAFEGDAGKLGSDTTVIDPAYVNGDEAEISAPRTVGQIDGLIGRMHPDPTTAGIDPLPRRE